MVGVTVESQEAFDSRRRYIEELAQEVPVFLSCEPLLSPIEFPPGWLGQNVAWLICGGESGRSARPMHPNWARGLRDQATAAGVPFHFKQWGTWGQFGEASPGMRNALVKIGKKAAGRHLDGVTWDEVPDWFAEVPVGL